MTANTVARFAVVGHPVAHSQSPFIHQEFARQTGLELDYENILAALDGFNDTVRQFFASVGKGLNITVPFKQEAWQLARAHLSPRAARAAAVNTLWMQGNALHGCNTDGRSEEHTSELQSRGHLVCRLLLEKKKTTTK